ncbi:MAG TPA: hypothetical protein DIW47_14870 [Bacteroidetes bacterium]|nr:hypothetical protein [Bacteroidota bacterium]
MPKATSIKIPITIENIDGDGYHLFMEIKIGRKKLRALVDTGASKSVIGKESISKLKGVESVSESESQAKGIGEQMLDTTIARINKLKMGTAELRNLHVGVLDLSHIRSTYKSIGIDPFTIIIGGDVLAHFGAVINYKKSWIQITVCP